MLSRKSKLLFDEMATPTARVMNRTYRDLVIELKFADKRKCDCLENGDVMGADRWRTRVNKLTSLVSDEEALVYAVMDMAKESVDNMASASTASIINMGASTASISSLSLARTDEESNQ